MAEWGLKELYMKTEGKIMVFWYSEYFYKISQYALPLQEELNPDRNSVRNDPKLIGNDNVAFKYVTWTTLASKYLAYIQFTCMRLPVAA